MSEQFTKKIVRRQGSLLGNAFKRHIAPLEESTYSGIPDLWKEQDFWLPYHLIERKEEKIVNGVKVIKNRMDKVPFNFQTGRAKYMTPDGSWLMGDFYQALEAAREYEGDGIGFRTGGALVAFDLDAALEDGEPKPWAADALKILAGAYVELSVSRTGVKAIVWCDDPPTGKPWADKGEGDENHHRSHVQLLSATGFNAVTGNTVSRGKPTWSRLQVDAACANLGITWSKPKDAVASASAPIEWDEELVRDALSHIDPDCQRDEWIRVGMALRSGGGSEELWLEWSKGDLTGEAANTYDEKAARSAWRSFKQQVGVTLASLFALARKNGWQQVAIGSEAWLVDRAVPLLSGQIRYIEEDRDWAVWTEGRWRRWSQHRARRLIHQTNVDARAEIYRGLNAIPQKQKAEIIRNARDAQTIRVANASMGLLAGELHGSSWDLDTRARTGGYLNFRNGMVNLRTGELEPHDPTRGFSRVIRYDYDPRAECPLWDEHIASTFKDQEIAEAFRMGVGYTVCGLNDGKVFILLHGPKNTGKSTTSEGIDRALDTDFAETVKRGVFMRQRSVSDSANSHDANVIVLVGRRKINIHEPDAGARWDEELIKQWTGGDGIALRRIYGETSTFHPQGVIWALCNELPKADEFSEAFWSRALVFPFEVRRQVREGFLQEMLAELPGIGAWCVRAARDYLAAIARGESPLQAARVRTERSLVQARFAENPLALWLAETYEADKAGEVRVDALVKEATDYFQENPEMVDLEGGASSIGGFLTHQVNEANVGRVLRSLGLTTDRVGSGKTGKYRVARVRPRLKVTRS